MKLFHRHEWQYSTMRSYLIHTDKLNIDTIMRYCPKCCDFETIGYDVWMLGGKPFRRWVTEEEAQQNCNIFYEIEREWQKKEVDK